MKKFKFLAAFVAFATLLGLTGCSDDQAELLNGGQGPAGSVILNVNYTIPGEDTKVFAATSVGAVANDTDIVITAENEDTGESLEIYFTGNKEQTPAQESYVASVTFIDANGNEYSALSPFTGDETGAVRLSDIDTKAKTITGVFSFIGYDGTEVAPAEGVPFFSGIFMSIPYTGTLPEPDPTTNPGDTFIKATIGGTTVDFATVTSSILQGSTAFQGANASPLYTIQIVFPENNVIVQGATLTIGDEVEAQTMVGTSAYFANEGSLTITNITNGVATGTFHFSASDIDDVQSIEVTNGEFKMEIE